MSVRIVVLLSLAMLFSCEKDKLVVEPAEDMAEAVADKRNDISIEGLPDWFREYIADTYNEEDLEWILPLLNPRWTGQAI